MDAARRAFTLLGEVAGDAMALVTTLIDGLVVIGGGLAAAHRLFMPALVAEMNGTYRSPAGDPFRRLVQVAFDLEDPDELERFLRWSNRWNWQCRGAREPSRSMRFSAWGSG